MLINLHAATINLKADLGGWQLSNSCRLDNGVETLKLILKNDEKSAILNNDWIFIKGKESYGYQIF